MHKAILDAQKILKKRGYTQQDISDMTGKDRTLVSRQLYDPHSNPQLSTLEAYEDVLDAELRFLPREMFPTERLHEITNYGGLIVELREDIARLQKEVELKDKYIARLEEETAQYKDYIQKITNHIFK